MTCDTEPDLDDDDPLSLDRWDDWYSRHSHMPYVHWLPAEQAVMKWVNGCCGWYSPCHPDHGSTDGRMPSEEFRELWDSINEKRGFGWEVNPWVMVISFQREGR